MKKTILATLLLVLMNSAYSVEKKGKDEIPEIPDGFVLVSPEEAKEYAKYPLNKRAASTLPIGNWTELSNGHTYSINSDGNFISESTKKKTEGVWEYANFSESYIFYHENNYCAYKANIIDNKLILTKFIDPTPDKNRGICRYDTLVLKQTP